MLSSVPFWYWKPVPVLPQFLPSDADTVLQHWSYEEVVEVHRRRYELKDNALEFFLSNGKTVFLSFTKPKVNERGLSLWQQIYVLPWRQLLAVMNTAVLLLFGSTPASGGRILYSTCLLCCLHTVVLHFPCRSGMRSTPRY